MTTEEIKQEAQKLVDRFEKVLLTRFEWVTSEDAKACALIAVEKVLSEYEFLKTEDCSIALVCSKIMYYTQLKQVIQEL